MMNAEQYFRDCNRLMGVNPAKARRAFSYSVERLPSGCRLYRLTLPGTPSLQEAAAARYGDRKAGAR